MTRFSGETSYYGLAWVGLALVTLFASLLGAQQNPTTVAAGWLTVIMVCCILKHQGFRGRRVK